MKCFGAFVLAAACSTNNNTFVAECVLSARCGGVLWCIEPDGLSAVGENL